MTDPYRHLVNFGPISGCSRITQELMLYLGHDPKEHPEIARELEQAAGEELLDLGRDVLAAHGLAVRDSIGLKPSSKSAADT